MAKDERTEEKATRQFDLAMVDMLVAKNQFLLDSDIANVAKSRLYNSDLPALQDDLQLIETASVNQLVFLLGRFTAIERASLKKRLEGLERAEVARMSIDVEEDQRNFVQSYSAAKMDAWELPRDLEFSESSVWHDTVSLTSFVDSSHSQSDQIIRAGRYVSHAS